MTNLTDRRLWATLSMGSRLYGTAVEGSDTDILNLYLPEPHEMVANKHVVLPQCIKDGIDTRHSLLGDFVMSLGHNPEHMVLAYHYDDLFHGVRSAWLNADALNKMLDVALNMWTNANTPKNKAHAYRYMVSARLMVRSTPDLYPLTRGDLMEYMWLRNDDDRQMTDTAFRGAHTSIRGIVRSLAYNTTTDRQRLAEWTLLRYLGLHG